MFFNLSKHRNHERQNDAYKNGENMKRNEIGLYLEALQSGQEIKSAKVAYAIIKNKKMLIDELKNVEKTQNELLKQIQPYEDARIEMLKKHAKHDGTGNPMIKKSIVNGFEQSEFVLLDRDLFGKEWTEKQKELKEYLDKKETLDKSFNEFLNEEFNCIFHKVKIEEFPSDITANQLEKLEFIIA